MLFARVPKQWELRFGMSKMLCNVMLLIFLKQKERKRDINLQKQSLSQKCLLFAVNKSLHLLHYKCKTSSLYILNNLRILRHFISARRMVSV